MTAVLAPSLHSILVGLKSSSSKARSDRATVVGMRDRHPLKDVMSSDQTLTFGHGIYTATCKNTNNNFTSHPTQQKRNQTKLDMYKQRSKARYTRRTVKKYSLCPPISWLWGIKKPAARRGTLHTRLFFCIRLFPQGGYFCGEKISVGGEADRTPRILKLPVKILKWNSRNGAFHQQKRKKWLVSVHRSWVSPLRFFSKLPF